jgi:hypothetical protein
VRGVRPVLWRGAARSLPRWGGRATARMLFVALSSAVILNTPPPARSGAAICARRIVRIRRRPGVYGPSASSTSSPWQNEQDEREGRQRTAQRPLAVSGVRRSHLCGPSACHRVRVGRPAARHAGSGARAHHALSTVPLVTPLRRSCSRHGAALRRLRARSSLARCVPRAAGLMAVRG